LTLASADLLGLTLPIACVLKISLVRAGMLGGPRMVECPKFGLRMMETYGLSIRCVDVGLAPRYKEDRM